MTQVTNIRDARAMKTMGLPFDTPVVKGVTSKGAARRWTAIEKANHEFEHAIARYIERSNMLRYKAAKLYLNRYARLTASASEWATANIETDTSAVVIVGLAQRATAVVEYWKEAIEIAESEGELEIGLTKRPKLYDGDD
jgi:hypothetical protein